VPQLVDPMPCPLPAGAATLHDACTQHYASPNETDSDRRAVIIKAQIETLPADAPRTFP